MLFIEIIEKYKDFDFDSFCGSVRPGDIERILSKDKLSEMDFLALLSDSAVPHLEALAQKAQRLTVRNFGRVIQLYMPLYIANYCTNECAYCGFQSGNRIERRKLSLEEIEANALEISKSGIRHILFLTGEAPELTPLTYLLDATEILKKYFSSISIEIFPMDTADYRTLKDAGVDGLTIYQEVYDREVYDRVHLRGKKKDYLYRLDTPERGAAAGFRSIGIGPLFGLGDPVSEAFLAGMHARYLQDRFLEAEIGISLPRINEAEGSFQALHPLSDRKFVQFILAYRLFLPRTGITVSTRERASLRDSLVPLGVTKMSAGSMTSVGGYTGNGTPQFEVSDNRSVAEISCLIESKGYEAVYKDWDILEKIS